MALSDYDIVVYRADYDVNSNLIYEGWAEPGTATSAAKWAIIRHTYASNLRTVSQWAAGNKTFVNIWDNRASITSYE